MDEERDLELISIPFAVGVAIGVHIPDCAGTPLLCLCAFAILLFAAMGGKTPLLPTLFLLTGSFCGVTGSSPSLPTDWAAMHSAARLRALIDSIPFAYENSAALVKALLTGDRSGLESGVVSAFRQSGASHILALSGLHLGLIHLIVRRIMSVLGNSPVAGICRAILTTVAATYYTLMTGASPSTVRALLFIAISEWSGVSPGRRGSLKRSLLLALTLQLAIRPDNISSISFQMSYLAMCGIVFLLPGLHGWFPGDGRAFNPMKRIWDAAALSISCQIFTAPLAWIRFHTFPKYFLLTNIISLPLTSAAMVISAAVIALAAAGIHPLWLIAIDDRMLQALVSVLETISVM